VARSSRRGGADVLSRTLYDGVMQRVLPAVLCASIVYPMCGLSLGGPSGPYHTALFIASLCLTNLLGTAVITCIAIVCASSAVATILSVLFVLLSTLFCGFIVNLPTLAERGAWFGGGLGSFGPQYLSYLYYLNELVISDEMLGHTITIKANLEPGKPPQIVHTSGEEVLAHVGYQLNCTRIAGRDDLACWYDLTVPLGAVAFFVALSALLLAFCVKDPH